MYVLLKRISFVSTKDSHIDPLIKSYYLIYIWSDYLIYIWSALNTTSIHKLNDVMMHHLINDLIYVLNWFIIQLMIKSMFFG